MDARRSYRQRSIAVLGTPFLASVLFASAALAEPPPVCQITCPANLFAPGEVQPGGSCGRIVSYPAPIIQGTCGTVTCTPESGSTFPAQDPDFNGKTTVQCTTTAGPSCEFTVQILNVPAMRCVDQQFTVEHGPGDPATVFYQPATAEAVGCSPIASLSCNPPPGSAFDNGVTEVTCTAFNTAGVRSTCFLYVDVTSITVGAPIAGGVGLTGLVVLLAGLGFRAVRHRQLT